MVVLIIGLVMFLGVHAIAVAGLRETAIQRLGEGPYKGLYSLVSAAGLAAIVWGYGLARAEPTVAWLPPVWARHLSLTLMLPVFPLLLAAYLPGRIQRATKHPMLLATKIWATAHLLANGMVHDLLLFGGFLAWAVAVRVSLKRRAPRAIAMAPATPANDAIAVVAGLALYLATLWRVHLWLIGVAPM